MESKVNWKGRGCDEGLGWLNNLEEEGSTLGPMFSWSMMLWSKVSVTVEEEEDDEEGMRPPRPVPKRCTREQRTENREISG